MRIKQQNIINMESAVFGVMIFSMLFGLAIVLLIAILYLLNLQNTLKAASPENRKMPPANVWLLLIPLFSTYYIFVVTKRIAETIQAEYASKGQVLDNPQPTYKVGMALAICSAIYMLISFFTIGDSVATLQASMSGNLEQIAMVSESQSGALSGFSSIISLTAFVLFIVYWVQTAGYKNKMKNLPNNSSNSEIFNQF